MADEIDAARLRELRDTDADVRVLDIRSRLAYDRGHIPDSEHFPFHSVTENVGEVADADAIVTVCAHGQASKQAASLIRSYEGVDGETLVASLAGGLDDWDGAMEES